ncbi:hypothetical protein OO012_19360 [Rhodobacteraceae bacterium KMM 6894]|nr:hypothetical protein [Rhodobacteraceae bacterium KMM 6894]
MLKKIVFTPDSPEGSFLQVYGTDSMATLLWRSRFKESKLTPSIIAMAAGSNYYCRTLLNQAEVLNEKGYRTKAETEAGRLAMPWNNLRKAIIDEKSSLIERRKTMLKVERGNAAMRSEYRQWFRTMSHPELFITLVTSKDPELIASAIEGGPALIGLDGAVFDRIEERYAVVKFLYGGDKSFPPAPMTINNLAGTDPNWAALEKNARDQWVDIVSGSDEIQAAGQYLAGVLALVAASVADLTTRQAFEILKAA